MVSDTAGNGNCAGSFPLEEVMIRHSTIHSSSCSGTTIGGGRAPAIGQLPGLPPLTNQPLENGFSVPFSPKVAPLDITWRVDISGSGCQAFTARKAIAGKIKWADLDFQITGHTTYSIGGICSMKDLPRTSTVGIMKTSLSLEECEWNAFFFDPYATLP
jgi:hypothetical protein